MTRSEADIIEMISSGMLDDELDGMAQAIRVRKRFLQDIKGATNKAAFKPGTPVRIVGNIKPKYLIGIKGKVSTRPANRPGDLMVDVDPAYYRYLRRYSRTIGVPASCLEATDENAI